MSRIAQYRQAFSLTRERDPKLVLWMAVAFVLGGAFGAAIGSFSFGPIAAVLVGLVFAVLATLIVFGRRATNVQMQAIEGQPGAAAAVIQTMRGHWRVQLAVKVTAKQDFVHRAVGKPGIVIVGEGASARVSKLVAQEKARMKRVSGDTPVHVVRVGDGPDEIELKQLNFHIARLGKQLKKDEIDALANKLDALGGDRPPLPRGPMPRGRQR